MAQYRMKIWVGSSANDLPDEMLTEILTRLPIDFVILCKSICRRWRNLIKSPFFINFHLRKLKGLTTNSILYVDSCNLMRLYNSLPTIPQSIDIANIDFLHGSLSPQITSELKGSCDGLVVFDRRRFPIFVKVANPTTKEIRVIKTPPRGKNRGYICGFFFDRFNGDYKLLYIDVSRSRPAKRNDLYYVFRLSDDAWRRLDSIPSCLGFRPYTEYPPVEVCDALHWIAARPADCSKTIVVFDIKTGRMQALPHPSSVAWQNGPPLCSTNRGSTLYYHDKFMQLIVKDEKLCFCHIFVRERAIDLWILEEYGNWGSWVRKFKVNLLFVDKKFSSYGHSNSRFDVQVLSSPNGTNEILLCWRDPWTTWNERRLYRYHLATHWNCHLKTLEYVPYVILPYRKTLLSPSGMMRSATF